jgi:hypothetical protein
MNPVARWLRRNALTTTARPGGRCPETTRRPRRLQLEALEERASPTTVFRSIDGTGNNLTHPTWGGAGTDLLRIAPPGVRRRGERARRRRPAQRPGH